MSRDAELTGKGAQVGHKVRPLQYQNKAALPAQSPQRTLISDALGRTVKLRVSANAVENRRSSRRA